MIHPLLLPDGLGNKCAAFIHPWIDICTKINSILYKILNVCKMLCILKRVILCNNRQEDTLKHEGMFSK